MKTLSVSVNINALNAMFPEEWIDRTARDTDFVKRLRRVKKKSPASIFIPVTEFSGIIH